MVALSHDRTCDSQVRLATANDTRESYGRTDGRTYVAPTNDSDILQLSDVRARVQAEVVDIPSLGDVLAAGITGTGERYEVIRTGERDPIPYQVRAAVWLRDRGICQKCYARNPKPWNLDHIVPWSTGGSDESTNLRVLCERCNVNRSNYDDGTTFARRPVTWWCSRCYGDPTWITYERNAVGEVVCPIHSRFCHLGRVIKWQAQSDESTDWFFRSLPIESVTTPAYCAHCGIPGMTDVTL